MIPIYLHGGQSHNRTIAGRRHAYELSGLELESHCKKPLLSLKILPTEKFSQIKDCEEKFLKD